VFVEVLLVVREVTFPELVFPVRSPACDKVDAASTAAEIKMNLNIRPPNSLSRAPRQALHCFSRRPADRSQQRDILAVGGPIAADFRAALRRMGPAASLRLHQI
jgi:hypothetical protein